MRSSTLLATASAVLLLAGSGTLAQIHDDELGLGGRGYFNENQDHYAGRNPDYEQELAARTPPFGGGGGRGGRGRGGGRGGGGGGRGGGFGGFRGRGRGGGRGGGAVGGGSERRGVGEGYDYGLEARAPGGATGDGTDGYMRSYGAADYDSPAARSPSYGGWGGAQGGGVGYGGHAGAGRGGNLNPTERQMEELELRARAAVRGGAGRGGGNGVAGGPGLGRGSQPPPGVDDLAAPLARSPPPYNSGGSWGAGGNHYSQGGPPGGVPAFGGDSDFGSRQPDYSHPPGGYNTQRGGSPPIGRGGGSRADGNLHYRAPGFNGAGAGVNGAQGEYKRGFADGLQAALKSRNGAHDYLEE